MATRDVNDAVWDANYAYAYQYDDIGNRVTSSERGTNTIYSANELNQYTSIVGGPAESEPEFDDDGNQTLIRTGTGTWRVTYNGENRPILWEPIEQSEQSTNQTILTMSYDRLGRRVTKNAERFVYDGYLQIANIQSPTPTQNSNCFTWDPTEPIATCPLVWLSSALRTPHSALYYTHDGNKNVSEVVSNGRHVFAHYEYAPYGGVSAWNCESAILNPWQFSSEYADGVTSLMYVEDMLGLQPNDGWFYKLAGWFFKSRNVKRAQWVLSGSGTCSCCKE